MTAATNWLRRLSFPQWAGALAIVFGGVVLTGWALELPALKSVFPGGVAVKANTALALIFLGMALSLDHPAAPPVRGLVARLLFLSAGLIGLLTLGEYLLGWNPGFDQWLFREPVGAVATSHPGRMAPDTALCLVLLAAALGARQTRWGLVGSVICGSLVATVALAAIMASLTPSLRNQGWWGLTIMAPSTAIVLALLSAVLVVDGWREIPARSKWGFGFAGLTLLLLATGWWYYRAEWNFVRQGKYAEIAGIGELKAGQIQQWRHERLGDAMRIASGSFVSKAVTEFLRDPNGPIRAELLARLKVEQATGDYADALLFAPGGTLLLAASDTPGPPSPATQRVIAAALAGRAAMISDFFRQPDGTIQIDTAAALRDAAGQPLAVAIMRSDAAAYLYPLIQKWPTPSRTAETFIVQREEDTTLFLNEARHRAGTALTLRQPLSRTDIPGVQAVLGRQGVFEGVDYRGMAVLSDLRPIAGSPWFMVAKVDADEIFSEARARTATIALAVGTLILLAAVTTRSIYRQQNAAAVSRLNAYNRSLIEASLDPLVTISPEGKITDVNAASAEVTGLPREQLIGRDFSDFFTEPGQARAGYEQVFTHGFVRDYPLAIRHTNGRITDVLYNAAIYKDEAGEVLGVFAAARDITERKKAQEEIQTLNAGLEQRVRDRTAELTAANMELDSFSYTVSHDLRAPLRAMSGFSQALVEDYGELLQGEAREYLHQITVASQHMGGLVDGLLTLSRSTRGELRRDAIDLTALCEHIRRGLTQTEPDRPVEWRIQPNLIARGDPGMIEAVLTNLIGNAWKFTVGQNAPLIRIHAERIDGKQFFCVTDNGAGFDMKHVENLFKPFQRLHRQDEFPGIGIGLATAQRILHRHGGTIHATAAVGLGASFRFSLPETEPNKMESS